MTLTELALHATEVIRGDAELSETLAANAWAGVQPSEVAAWLGLGNGWTNATEVSAADAAVYLADLTGA